MPLTRRPAPLMVLLIALLLTLSVTSVPALLGQEATAEATEEPAITSTPVSTQTPAPEQTETAAPESTEAPTPEQTETAAPESTEAPAPEQTETAAPESTEAPAENTTPYSVEFICTERGSVFVITNNGPDMADPDFYYLTMDILPAITPTATAEPVDEPDVEPTPEPMPEPVADAAVPGEAADEAGQNPDADGEEEPAEVPEDEPIIEPAPGVEGTLFQLTAGETLTIDAGYGSPSLRLGEKTYQPEKSCGSPTPVLSVSAVCEFETGVAFTVENSGGPMRAELAYTVTGIEAELAGAYLLGANESITIEAGYGAPVFMSGEVTSMLEEPCYEPATISGVIWDDLDLDGARGEAEPGLANVTVTLTDPAGFALTTVTAEDGSYRFEMLPAATFIVGVDTTTLPPDYVLMTAPVDLAEAAVTLDVILDLDYTADFGFVALPTASISGTVWLETGNFGVRDASEMGVAGAMVELLDETGALLASVPVDAATGAYTFAELFSGEYTIRLAQATLFTPIGVTWDLDGDLNFETAITLEAGQALIGADFGIAGTF